LTTETTKETSVTTAFPTDRADLVGVLFGANAFQMLNAGVDLGLFVLLHEQPELTAPEIGVRLRLAARPTQMLLLGATALGLAVRTDGRYRNGPVIEEAFADGFWEILVDLVAFQAQVVYAPAADFTASLREDTNAGLTRFPGEGADLYHRLAADPSMEQLFYRCMRSWSRLSNPVLLANADLTGVRRVLDVGGGDGVNAIALAAAHPDVRFTVLDLPGATAIARKKIADQGLTDRIAVREGDIFAEPYPDGHDCVLFANQLLIWSPEQNLALLRNAYQALPPGGRVLVFSAMSDESGDGPLYAALDNVYFATLPAGASTIYHWGQYEDWLTAVGFSAVRRLPGDTWTPHGVVDAVK
jgi:L-tyrosine C(3)-methyltransferase